MGIQILSVPLSPRTSTIAIESANIKMPANSIGNQGFGTIGINQHNHRVTTIKVTVPMSVFPLQSIALPHNRPTIAEKPSAQANIQKAKEMCSYCASGTDTNITHKTQGKNAMPQLFRLSLLKKPKYTAKLNIKAAPKTIHSNTSRYSMCVISVAWATQEIAPICSTFLAKKICAGMYLPQ